MRSRRSGERMGCTHPGDCDTVQAGGFQRAVHLLRFKCGCSGRCTQARDCLSLMTKRISGSLSFRVSNAGVNIVCHKL